MIAANYKKILRNTGVLYIRMLFAMVVGLYTSRVALEVLGVDDFGIYHVVAGFVALLGFMHGAMTTATQRYFAYDLGNDNGRNLRGLFNTSLQVHVFIAFIIFFIAETAGYWFVRNKLNIPAASFHSAMTAYHLSVIAFVISVLTVPFTAMLMAHENMKQFAFMGILDVFLKLFVVLLLPYLPFEKLSGYAALLLCVSLIVFLGYFLIHYVSFPTIKLQCYWNKKSFLGMLGFAGWNTWGNLAAALSEQGNNILLNIFFGPAVNAARAIAGQANGALNSFVMNVQAAVNPQIVKLYAGDKKEQVHQMVLKMAKYNFFILFLLSIAVLFYTKEFLMLWLESPPEYAVVFLQMTIAISLIDSISKPIMTLVQSTGKIRLYQSVVGGVLLFNVPLSFAALIVWNEPSVVLWVGIFVTSVAIIPRLIITKNLSGLSIFLFFKNVVFVVFKVALLAVFFNSVVVWWISRFDINWIWGSIFVTMITFLNLIIFGLDAYEKKTVSEYALKIFRRVG